MTLKPLNIVQVKFAAKASPELRAQLIQSCERAGLLWCDLGAEVVEREVQRVCVMAAHAVIVDMAKNWTRGQWESALLRSGADEGLSHSNNGDK